MNKDTIVIKDEKTVITLETDDCALVMDADKYTFELVVPVKHAIYAEVFKMFVWLMSGSDLANEITTVLSLAYYTEMSGRGKEKPNMVEKARKVVSVRNPSSTALVEDLFKNVGKK